MDDFISHWQLAEHELGASGPLIVLAGFQLSDLRALRETLNSDPVDVNRADSDERLASKAVKSLRRALHAGMKRFNLWVRAEFPETKWERLLLRVPKANSGCDRFLPPVRSTLCLWERLQAAEPGIHFPDFFQGLPYSREQFAEECRQFEAALDAHTDAGLELRLARTERQMLEARAVAAMKAYGHGVKARLGDDSRLAASLPQLWPGPRRGSRRRAQERGAPRPPAGLKPLSQSFPTPPLRPGGTIGM